MAAREIPVIPPHIAYGRGKRVRYAYRFIRNMARQGSYALERTQSRFVGVTYGVEESLVKRMKKRFRNELSFSAEGK